LELGSLRRYAPILRRKALRRALEKSLSACSPKPMYLATSRIYIPPLVTTRPPTEVLHIDDSVSEDVHDFCLASTHDPLALRPVEMDVPVQPQGGS
jgi:hypothetical protein